MKKLNFLFAAMFIALAGFLTSCGDDTETLTPPTISVEQTTTGDIEPGATVSFKVVLGTSNGDLTTFDVTGTGSIHPAPGSGIVSTDPADKYDAEKKAFVKNTASVTVIYELKVGADLKNGDTFEVEFKVADAKEQFNSVKKTITIGGEEPAGTKFTASATSGAINHAYGAGKGGYDLSSDAQVSLGASVDNENVDMFNLSKQATAFDASFRAGTGKSTKYAKMSGVTFEDVTVEAVKTAVASGSANVSSPVAGDLYGAVLSDGSTYAIIKIESISTTGSQSKSGEGYMKFSYKKGTIPAGK